MPSQLRTVSYRRSTATSGSKERMKSAPKILVELKRALRTDLDHRYSHYVALKGIKTKASLTPEPKLLIRQRIKEDYDYSMAKHVMIYLDTFHHRGARGQDLRPNHLLWGSMAKGILKHALIGLAFLHKNDIIHGDLWPGNTLPATSNTDSLPEDDLQQVL
ncbi:hypothetical protein PV10_01705 [Exophiala mesophila]|uniref:Protein kinase domain-containing protein n=1 Tax=Exophiala mesophila TaxID=212818 RepID=A0A0D1YBN2_EXOME|nr:uncharacterized protein PV10_01705 [Exophiala mesophila]KIV98011.1 hypothetical protein PV10_01705 [Exophiala mesophila]